MKKLLLVILVALNTIIVNAQWQQTNGLYGRTINCLTVSGTNIFAGTQDSGVYLTTNNGKSWSEVNNGLTDTLIKSIAISGTNIFAATWGGLYLSNNNGNSWTKINNGLTSTQINTLAINGTNIFAGTNGGIFLSTNNGNSWSKIDTGIIAIWSFTSSGSSIFAGTLSHGVLLSKNNGGNWSSINIGLTNKNIRSLAIMDSNIYAGSESGIFLSALNGSSWSEVDNGIKPPPTVNSFAVLGTNIFAGAYGGVFLSTDNGNSWTKVMTGLPNIHCYSLVISGSYIYAAIKGEGVWKRPLSEMGLVGISDLKKGENNFDLYPNPANSDCYISSDKESITDLKVYNSIGELTVTYTNIHSNFYTLKIDHLSKGIYFIQIRLDSGEILIRKIIIN